MSETSFKKKYGSWAIIAGGAEGLGKSYSTALAKRRMNLILVDNQVSSLSTLADNLEQEFDIKCNQVHIDLAEANSCDEIMTQVKLVDCHLLIYNAAYSLIKPFLKHSQQELDNYISINTGTQIKLVHAFAQHLNDKNEAGGILLMSSLAGLMGMQLVAPYAATKAFAWNLAEALHHELKANNIEVLACIAGATATPAYLKTKPQYGLIKPTVMHPDKVAELALRKLGKKTMYVPGFMNRLNYFLLTRLMPRKMASAIANKTMLGMYRHQL